MSFPQLAVGRTTHKSLGHSLTINGNVETIAKQKSQKGEGEWTVVKKKKASKRKRDKSPMELETEALDSGNCNPEKSDDRKAETNASEKYYYMKYKELLSNEKWIKALEAKRKDDDLVMKFGAVAIAPEPDAREKKRVKKKRKKAEKETIENKISKIEIVEEVKSEDKKLCSADKLNYRIAKRKKKRNKIREKKRLQKLSESLGAVNICEDSVDSGRGEDLVEGVETKRSGKGKKDKKAIRQLANLLTDCKLVTVKEKKQL